MKKIECLLPLLWLSCFFIQCTLPKRIKLDKDSSRITQLTVFPSYADIGVIEKKDKIINSGSYSTEAGDKVKQQLMNYIPGTISTKFLACNEALEETIINANIRLIKTVKSSSFFHTVTVPDVLLNVLDSLGENYGLFLYHGGFSRSQENLQREYFRRKTLGIVSLGYYNTVPNSTYSVMIGILIDRKKKQVIMYKELYWRNKDPNAETVIRSQVRDIIGSYFRPG